MPSDEHTGLVAALVAIGVVVPLYTVIISQRLLPGLGVGLSALVTAALVARDGTGRETLVRATMAVTVVYGAFTLQLPVAVIAACAVYLSAWLTGVDSPFGAPDAEIVPVEPGVTGEAGDGENTEDSGDSEDGENTEDSGDSEDGENTEDSGDSEDGENTEDSGDSEDGENTEDSGDSEDGEDSERSGDGE